MCRNIRKLFNFEPPASDREIAEASLQFVRKISGSTRPSRANEAAFNRAVEEISEVTKELLDSLISCQSSQQRPAAMPPLVTADSESGKAQ